VEKLEMSGILTAVSEVSGILLKVGKVSGKKCCEGEVAGDLKLLHSYPHH